MRTILQGPPVLLLLGGLSVALAGGQAHALSEIPFYVTNDTNNQICVAADGPWFRTSGQRLIGPQVTGVNFYSAEINIFSPYGLWTIDEFAPNPSGVCERPLCCVSANAYHCDVNERWSSAISLSVDRFGAFRVAGADCVPVAAAATAAATTAGASTVAAAGFLGHNEQEPGAAAGTPRGSDHFRFEGRAGDTVELVLDRDGARGSMGKVAQLSLRGGGGGVLGKRRGAVPLQLKATLPAAGRYRVEVAEVDGGSGGEPFRGHYRLRVTSGSGTAILLEPLRSVEP